MGFGPQLVDLTGDGKRDVISGSWPGQIYLFPGETGGKFGEGRVINDKDGKRINIDRASAIFAADWDSDGDLDLVHGGIKGEVHLIPNDGDAKEYRFGKAQNLKAGGRTIRVNHGDAGPCVADWDGDGLADLLLGSGAGGVVWHRNVGTAKKPRLAEGKPLVPETATLFGPAGGEKPASGMRTKVGVTDWNEDGRLDLVVGDFNQWAPPKDKKEPPKRGFFARMLFGGGGGGGGMHGYVWVYLRKAPEHAAARSPDEAAAE